MKLTIAIPTHNRAGSLAQTLASLRGIVLRPGLDAECVVVDNASTDGTSSIVISSSRDLPVPVQVVTETRIGSSYARNRAIVESTAEFVFFIDDDVTIDSRWAIELLSEMERRSLDVACGLVIPEWPGPLPKWLGPELYVKLAVHRTDGESDREALDQYFSANVGFRRAALDHFGTFREDLGVVGKNPMSGEDTELFARIIDQGGRIGFAERAVVHHRISPDRLTRQYFRRKSFAFGFGTAVKGGRSHNSPEKLIRNAVRMAVAAARGDAAGAFYHELECVNFFGYWRGRLGRRLPR